MSGMDKMHNAADKVAGKAKEALGHATDDPTVENKGRADQAKADLKQAGEKVKDALRH